jgi:predicted ester cyclase
MSRRFLAVAPFAAAALALTGCNPPDTAESNKALMHQYHVDVWERHDLGSVDSYIAPDFVSHANTPDTPAGPGPVKGFLEALFTAFPDLTSQEDGVLADGDKVAIQWTVRGTQTGYLFQMPPTGKPVEVSGMDVLRVQNGQFVEHWGGIGDQFPKIYGQLQQQ